MPSYQFSHRGKTVNVEIDFYDNNVQWYLRYYSADGLLNEYQVIGYPNVVGEQIEVTFCYKLIRPSNGEVLKSRQDSYYEPNLEAFYRMKIGDNEYGHFAGLQATNGLIARLAEFDSSKQTPATGYRIFNQLGQFYQPVVFDVAYQAETFSQQNGENIYNQDGSVTVSVVDGIAPFEYRLDLATDPDTPVVDWQESAVFSELSSEDYRLSVRDAAGTVRFQQVSIQLEYFEAVEE